MTTRGNLLQAVCVSVSEIRAMIPAVCFNPHFPDDFPRLGMRFAPTASAHSWVVWASWRDCCLYGIPLLEFVCVSLLVV